jgi:hypothetical protein
MTVDPLLPPAALTRMEPKLPAFELIVTLPLPAVKMFVTVCVIPDSGATVTVLIPPLPKYNDPPLLPSVLPPVDVLVTGGVYVVCPPLVN